MDQIPEWLWQNVLSDFFTEGLILAAWLAWKYRATFADWYYVSCYQLTKPFKKDSFNESATLSVVAVGVIKSRHDPYSGEWFTVKRDFD